MTDLERVTQSLDHTNKAMKALQGKFKHVIVNGYVEAAYRRLHQAELDLMAARAVAVQDEAEKVQP